MARKDTEVLPAAQPTAPDYCPGATRVFDQVKIIDPCVSQARATRPTSSSQSARNRWFPDTVLAMILPRWVPKLPLEGMPGLRGRMLLGSTSWRIVETMGLPPRCRPYLQGTKTTYTDVMTEKDGGRRTYFHNRGGQCHLGWIGNRFPLPASASMVHLLAAPASSR